MPKINWSMSHESVKEKWRAENRIRYALQFLDHLGITFTEDQLTRIDWADIRLHEAIKGILVIQDLER